MHLLISSPPSPTAKTVDELRARTTWPPGLVVTTPRSSARTPRGIQYVEHTDGAEMFKAVCKLGLEGLPQRSGCTVSLRPVQELDQGQESEITHRNRAIDGTYNTLAKSGHRATP